MGHLVETFGSKNPVLLSFGILCFLGALICMVLARYNAAIILGVNAWLKPLKFFISIGVFAWTMLFYLHFLSDALQVAVYSWVMTVLLSLELFFITFQAARGRTSHYNLATGLDSMISVLMGIVITLAMLHTCYIFLLFVQQKKFNLPPPMVLAMRLGLLSMIVFALEGFLMVRQMKHTVGQADGSPGLPLLNWSGHYGDLRVAHFFGMHGLQLIPLAAYFFACSKTIVYVIALIYFLLVTYTLIQALYGRPFIK